MSELAVSDQLVEAVLTDLNAGAFNLPVAAIQSELPQFTLEEYSTLRVTVTDNDVPISHGTFDDDLFDYQIDIGIQKRAANDVAAVREMKKLAQDILDHFRTRRPQLCDAVFWSSTIFTGKGDPVYREWLRENRVVFIIVRLTYRMLR